jgi:hypothetical protein
MGQSEGEEGFQMTYCDSLFGKDTLELEPHPWHGLPVPIFGCSCENSEWEVGHLDAPRGSAQHLQN